MADGTDTVKGRRRLPFFRSTRPDRPIARRRQSTVHWHRGIRSFLYLIAWIFLVLVEIGNLYNKPVLRDTYFLYLDLSNIIPVSVPNSVLINSIARSIGLHDFYQVGLWNFCEGYDDEGITGCSKPKALYAFNPVNIILNELLSGASIALPSSITSPLHLAKVASRWMFGIFLAAAVLNFIMIFLSPLAVSSRPPQAIKYLVGKDGQIVDSVTNRDAADAPPGGRMPHKRRTFILLRSLPFLFLTFFTALLTIVASVVATVMFVIFANVFETADESLNIKAHIGKQMFAFMWIASAFSLFGFILQFGSCCAACCGGHKARKKLKQDGFKLHAKNGISNGHSSPHERPQEPLEPHAVSTED
ncbi:Actin cortical patch SUR7/pH-response regulator PalI [Penicillium malachiteum]|nr:Actin cortical patch SUR7/pH-response regulator PalI [Penicillium malachiteum]